MWPRLPEGEGDGGRVLDRNLAGSGPVLPQRRPGQPGIRELRLIGLVRGQVAEPVLQLFDLLARSQRHKHRDRPEPVAS